MKGTHEPGSACSSDCGWCGRCTGGQRTIACIKCGEYMPLEKPAYDDPPLRPICDRCLRGV